MKKQNLNLISFAIIILFTFSFSYSSEKNIAKGKASIIDGDTIKINNENTQETIKFIEKLEEDEDVQNVYTNLKEKKLN